MLALPMDQACMVLRLIWTSRASIHKLDFYAQNEIEEINGQEGMSSLGLSVAVYGRPSGACRGLYRASKYC